MSAVIEKPDIKKVIMETHNRWDRNEYRSKEEEIRLRMDTEIIQEIIRKRERQNLPLDEQVIVCWKEYSKQSEGEGKLGLDPALIEAIGLATWNVTKSIITLIFTYFWIKRKSMPLDKLIEIINLEG